MAPLARTLGCAHPSETVAEAISREILLICSLDGDRNHSETLQGVPSCVAKCFCNATETNSPRTLRLSRATAGLLLNLGRTFPVDILELAWIVRKKPIWSTS